MRITKKIFGLFKNYGFKIQFVLFGLILLPPYLPAQTLKQESGTGGKLVSVEWLEKNRADKNIIILDASPAQLFAAEHIPGALNADFIMYGVNEAPLSEIEERCRALGISADKKIVIYDRGAPMMATRLFFDLSYYGFPEENLFILNGGLGKWKGSGMPVTSEAAPAPEKSNFRITKLNSDIRIKLPEFLTASGDVKNNVLMEALDANWHYGEQQFFDRPGHIPNSTLLPNADFFNADKTFKSPDEILKMLNYLGISKEKRILTYCGGGVAASVPFFALKYILDFKDVKLFRESEMGWVQDERGLPFWTYDAPFLMREWNWLKTWGGKIMRMYGISQVSIIDINSPEQFKQGHIPFALNIPADLISANLSNPGKLAEILAQSGVNVSHEAIIVSGKGLNENSALAFLALELLGQKKVSVFTDTYEKLARGGTTLSTDADNANARKPGNAGSVYPLNLRKGIIIIDPRSSSGVYDKIFIASGKTIPAKTPEGKVISIPSSEFLKGDGTPKEAKEIWKILQNAGVSRYAELICFSDNPGEAALNYYILKLMGFPDIKVLLN